MDGSADVEKTAQVAERVLVKVFDLWAFRLRAVLGAGLAIALIGGLVATDRAGWLVMAGSLGASAVVVFSTPGSPLGQPYSLLAGQVIGAAFGVAVALYGPEPLWLSAGLAVGGAILLMALGGATHPPGGASALIAVVGLPGERAIDWSFVPAIGGGALILLLVALIVHNIPGPGRKGYPLRHGKKGGSPL